MQNEYGFSEEGLSQEEIAFRIKCSEEIEKKDAVIEFQKIIYGGNYKYTFKKKCSICVSENVTTRTISLGTVYNKKTLEVLYECEYGHKWTEIFTKFPEERKCECCDNSNEEEAYNEQL